MRLRLYYTSKFSLSHPKTKMILGWNCFAVVNITDQMMEMAIDRLKTFAFVGDTDDWDNSICLFHAMFGDKFNAHSVTNVRPTHNINKKYDPKLATELIKPEDDPHDWKLYLAAKQLIEERRKVYGYPVYIRPERREKRESGGRGEGSGGSVGGIGEGR